MKKNTSIVILVSIFTLLSCNYKSIDYNNKLVTIYNDMNSQLANLYNSVQEGEEIPENDTVLLKISTTEKFLENKLVEYNALGSIKNAEQLQSAFTNLYQQHKKDLQYYKTLYSATANELDKNKARDSIDVHQIITDSLTNSFKNLQLEFAKKEGFKIKVEEK
jgi:hypothetical protein